MNTASAAVTRMDRERFMDLFSSVFEHSPWIVEAAWQEQLAFEGINLDGLMDRFNGVLAAATEDERLSLLRAHPELAPRRAEQRVLTAESRKEQQSAGLDSCSEEELQAFRKLNELYRERFGFPFIMAVTGFSRHEILEQMKHRVDGNPQQEFETALDEVMKIARIRVQANWPQTGEAG